MNFYLNLHTLTLAAEPDAPPAADATTTTSDSAVSTAPVAEGTPALTGIAGAAMVIITMLLTLVTGWLRTKFKSDSELAQLDASKSLMEQKNFLIDKRLIPFAISTAEHWFMSQLPFILQDATDGNGFQWKDHWTRLQAYVKERILAKFLAENVDIVRFMGEKELDDLVDRLLLKLISKLPDSVKALIPTNAIDEMTDKLTKKATDFIIHKGTDLLTKKA